MVRVVSLSASSKPAWLVSKPVSTYCKETIVQITTPLISSTRTYSSRLQNHVTSPPFITTFTDPIVLHKHIPKWRKRNIHTNRVVFDVSKMSTTQTAKKTRKRTSTTDSILLLSDVILSVEFLKALCPLG